MSEEASDIVNLNKPSKIVSTEWNARGDHAGWLTI
jgi:hypothetical protein